MRLRVTLLTAVLAFTFSAQASDKKLSRELRGRNDQAGVDVIVQFAVQPTQAHLNRVLGHHGVVNAQFDAVKALHVTMSASEIKNLGNDPDVAYVSLDRPLKGYLDNTVPAVGADFAWGRGFDGTGVGVALIDSGIQDNASIAGIVPGTSSKKAKKSVGTLLQTVASVAGNADLNYAGSSTSRVVYNQSWVNDGLNAVDGYGHGTHIAGIIAGNGTNSTGNQYTRTFKGIAPNSQLVNLRVLDQNGAGTDSSVIAAINTAIRLKKTYNIRVINLSLGRPVFESYKLDPLCQAVEAAWKAGIVVVVSAGNNGRDNSSGNNGYATITAPGNDPYVITVGAMKAMGTPARADDLIASYSSKGPTLIDHIAKPDLVAPGNHEVSLFGAAGYFSSNYPANEVPKSYYHNGNSSKASVDYYMMSGTSMAAGAVSGAVALVLEAQPTLTPDQVKARLMKSAYKVFPQTSAYTDPTTGITYTSQYDIFMSGRATWMSTPPCITRISCLRPPVARCHRWQPPTR